METITNLALKARLKEAIQQLGRDPGQAPTGTKEGRENRKVGRTASGLEQAPPVRIPPQVSDVPSETLPHESSAGTDREKSVHEQPPGDSRITKSPASAVSDSEFQAATEKAQSDLVQAKAPAHTESTLLPEGLTSSPARVDQPAADSVARPDDPGAPGKALSPAVAVLEKSVAEETETGESPGTEETQLQASPITADAPRQLTTGDKGPPDPGRVSGLSPENPAVSRSDSDVTEYPDPSALEATTAVQLPIPVSGPTSEPSPPKVKSKAKRATKPVAPAPAEAVATTDPGASLADLESYLAGVMQKITGLFRDRDGDRLEFLARCALVERENQQLRAKLAEAERNAEITTSALEAARAASAEQVARISALQSRLEAGEQATRKAEERARQLDKDLEDAFGEIEETERRAGDKVHRAEKEKELGVKTFRFELRRRIEPYLSEVLDEERDLTELSAEQARLHQRLRKILGVLRDTGVIGE